MAIVALPGAGRRGVGAGRRGGGREHERGQFSAPNRRAGEFPARPGARCHETEARENRRERGDLPAPPISSPAPPISSPALLQSLPLLIPEAPPAGPAPPPAGPAPPLLLQVRPLLFPDVPPLPCSSSTGTLPHRPPQVPKEESTWASAKCVGRY
ncbi:basic proline-rich protein isoform X4 [Sorghum bicolor]|uniref:basic proline-rich protein isoform X4 n=1 Tax=Sorghum bicolor TaxID=4558 RepID=UPI000B424DFE|nr:basic proline-rich protein isoform X4 [Sorghum bicolor]|eukprot:XP_021319102.1 basic proline-rich protein isoform X4 [Sorghum bicolor]